jgi:hypothetical protein
MISRRLLKEPLLYKKNPQLMAEDSFGDPAGARTQDTLLKRQVLYQLSYRAVMV